MISLISKICFPLTAARTILGNVIGFNAISLRTKSVPIKLTLVLIDVSDTTKQPIEMVNLITIPSFFGEVSETIFFRNLSYPYDGEFEICGAMVIGSLEDGTELTMAHNGALSTTAGPVDIRETTHRKRITGRKGDSLDFQARVTRTNLFTIA